MLLYVSFSVRLKLKQFSGEFVSLWKNTKSQSIFKFEKSN